MHTITVIGFTDSHGLDMVQLHCSCGWRSDEFDSDYFTIEELNERAANHVSAQTDWEKI